MNRRMGFLMTAGMVIMAGCGGDEDKPVVHAQYSGTYRGATSQYRVETTCVEGKCTTIVTDLSTSDLYAADCAQSELVIRNLIYQCPRTPPLSINVGKPEDYRAVIAVQENLLPKGYRLNATGARSVDISEQESGQAVIIQEGGNATSMKIKAGELEIKGSDVDLQIRASASILDRVDQ